MKAWKKTVVHPDTSLAFYKKIAHNSWIDHVRKSKRETLESAPEVIDTEQSSSENSTDLVQLLVNTLTPKQSVSFLLKEAFGFQVKEIADLFDTTDTAIKSTLHRANERLRRATEGQQGQSADRFWIDYDREAFTDLLYTTIHSQDPKRLLEVLPSLHSLRLGQTVPILLAKQHMRTCTPSGAVCMAA